MAHSRDLPLKQHADLLGGIMVQSPFEVQSDAVGPSAFIITNPDVYSRYCSFQDLFLAFVPHDLCLM